LTTGENTAHEQTGLRIAVFVKQIKNTTVPLEKRYLVWIGIEGESPLQDCAAASLVSEGWKIGQAADTVGNAGAILRNQLAGKLAVAKRSSEEDIWSRSPIEKVPRNPRSFPDTPLGGRGSVVFITRLNVGAMIDKELGRGYVSGEVKRSAAIAALGMHQAWIGTQ
jgi:hypothetical protein